MFFEYRDYNLPGRDNNFDPREHLPVGIVKKYNDLIEVMPENFYKFCLYHGLMEDDDFHPSPDGHLKWTRESLIPYLITRFQKTRSEEISVYGGYEFKLNSNIFLLIDSYQFRLKTKNEIAWAKTKQEDINIIQTLLNGSKVRIRSDSAIGTYAIDEYSLKGIVKAYGRIRAICQ